MKILDCQIIAAVWHQQLLNLSHGVLFCFVENKKSLCHDRRMWREAAMTVYRIQQEKMLERLPACYRVCNVHLSKRISLLVKKHQIATPEHDRGRCSFYFIDNVMAYDAWLFARNYWEGYGVTIEPHSIAGYDEKLKELQKQLIENFKL